MSAKRRITIKCDGPVCLTEHISTKAFVQEARKEVEGWWWKIGHSDQVGSRDFCTEMCETVYLQQTNPAIGEIIRPEAVSESQED